MGPLKKLLEKKDSKTIFGALIILAAGIALMLAGNAIFNRGSPEAGPKATAAPPAETARRESGELESRMEEILSLVDGAGKTRVLINYAKSPEKVAARNETGKESSTYETDAAGGTREQSQSDTQSSVVTISNGGGGEEPLILYEYAPGIEGVIIVAEGGGDIIVQDALIRAASSLLGIAVHKVTALKMAPSN